MLGFSLSRTVGIAIAVVAVAAGCSSLSGGSLPSDGINAAVHVRVHADSARSDQQLVTQSIENAIAAMPKPTPPGIAVAIYYKSHEYFYYKGVRRLGGAAVDGNTIFELGSLTKSFTAIMLGAAVDEKTAGVTLADHPAPWIAFVGNPNQTAPQPVQTSCAQPTATLFRQTNTAPSKR